MATVYRIYKWTETFERAESRKLKTLTWIAMPVSFAGRGYNQMADEFGDEFPAMYGAWCALCAFAAGCHVRGTLGDHRGNPLTTRHIARVTAMPVEVFERLIEWASRPDVGWLETISREQHLAQIEQTQQTQQTQPKIPGPDASGESPDNPPSTRPDTTVPDSTGPDKTEQNKSRRTDGWASAGVDFFESVREIANGMHTLSHRGKLRGLDRDTIWRMAWVACEFDRPGLLDALARIREGNVQKPKGYLGRAMIRMCESQGHNWDRVKHLVPDPPPEPQAPNPHHHGGPRNGQASPQTIPAA